MTFGDFTNEGVTAENGVVTITGLTTGRHIVKVEKDGKANYQVIAARQISYELQDADGNPLTEDTEIRAGDTIKIQFTGLVNPAEKMSGAYNFNARIVLEGQDGTTYQSSAGGAYGVYDFSGNPAHQNISITLPKYWAGSTYTLDGKIAMSGFANVGLGGHRGFNYEYGFAFRDTLFGGGSVFFLMQAFFQSVIGGLPAFDDGKDELRTRSLTATGEMGV